MSSIVRRSASRICSVLSTRIGGSSVLLVLDCGQSSGVRSSATQSTDEQDAGSTSDAAQSTSTARSAPADQAVIPVYDHGFVYGEGVYETLRTYNRVPFLYDRHIAPAARVGRATSISTCRSTTTRCAAGSTTPWPRSRLPTSSRSTRPTSASCSTRGVGELTYDVRATPAPSLVIIVKPLEEPPARVFDDGITISLVPILRNHPGSVNPIIKSNNLLNNALAMQEAHRRGAEEALMCNYRGELSECSQSNFFLVRDGVALTPRSQAGLLEGITRAFLFEVGREIGVEVEEATLLPGGSRDRATRSSSPARRAS